MEEEKENSEALKPEAEGLLDGAAATSESSAAEPESVAEEAPASSSSAEDARGADQVPGAEESPDSEPGRGGAEGVASEVASTDGEGEQSAAGSTEDSAAAAVEEPAEGDEEQSEGSAGGEGATASTGKKSKKRWYVVHTYSGHENKVKANLERAIQHNKMQDKFGEILVVTEDYAVMKGGKKRITKRKTFPSYVLIEMEMTDETRALVRNIPGVTHFLGDEHSGTLTEAEIRRIRGEEVKEKTKVTTEVPFKVGESVKVTEGPFADFVGTVDEIDLERGKLRVMVSIFGRPTAVELDLTHVTSI